VFSFSGMLLLRVAAAWRNPPCAGFSLAVEKSSGNLEGAVVVVVAAGQGDLASRVGVSQGSLEAKP
jgi:hypothetical protein